MRCKGGFSTHKRRPGKDSIESDPDSSLKPSQSPNCLGHCSVKKGEKGILFFTVKEVPTEEDGKIVIKRYYKKVYLFYILQVEER